jgi:hypothetical protein
MYSFKVYCDNFRTLIHPQILLSESPWSWEFGFFFPSFTWIPAKVLEMSRKLKIFALKGWLRCLFSFFHRTAVLFLCSWTLPTAHIHYGLSIFLSFLSSRACVCPIVPFFSDLFLKGGRGSRNCSSGSLVCTPRLPHHRPQSPQWHETSFIRDPPWAGEGIIASSNVSRGNYPLLIISLLYLSMHRFRSIPLGGWIPLHWVVFPDVWYLPFASESPGPDFVIVLRHTHRATAYFANVSFWLVACSKFFPLFVGSY